MKSKEWLFEAEQNVAKKKIDQQLDQLSDQEIDALLSVIDKSLNEGRFDYNPLAGPATKPQQSPPQQQKPKQPQPQPQKKPQPQKQTPKPKSEVKAYVDDLDEKEKEALKVVLQKEKEQRKETGEKVSAPPKSPSELKKWLGVLLVSMALGGVIGVGGPVIKDIIDKPAATATSKGELSDFSIKGIHFGMSPEQVAKATGNEILRWKLDPQWVSKYPQHHANGGFPMKTTRGLTIGGVEGWDPVWDNDEKLMGLKFDNKVMFSGNEYNAWVSKLTKQYGKPDTDRSFPSSKAIWNIKDATIELNVGGITIYDKSLSQKNKNELKSQYNKEISKQAKDF